MNEQQTRQMKSGGSKKKILLLEDYPDFIKFYMSKLQEAGYEVILEDDEDRGIEIAEKENPDLVILDISLPKNEDFGFVKELKKRPAIAAIPVLIINDLASETDIKNGMDSGAKAYFVRDNFTFNQVIDKIKEVIGGQ